MLQALSRPLYNTTITKYKRNRKGEVIRETKTNYTISLADILVAAALVLGPIVFLKLRAGLPNIVPDGASLESIDDIITNIVKPTPTTEQKIIIKRILDPFGWIWK